MPRSSIIFQPHNVLKFLNCKPGVWPAEPVDPSKPIKWATRRLVKHQGRLLGDFAFYEVDGNEIRTESGRTKPCPFGKVGDVLIVRESVWRDKRDPNVIIYDATPEFGKYKNQSVPERASFIDGGLPTREDARRNLETNKFWRRASPIHMPHWASRLSLKIMSIKVERLTEITNAAAKAEGTTGRKHFLSLWEQINGEKRDWLTEDSWVWVLDLCRVEPA